MELIQSIKSIDFFDSLNDEQINKLCEISVIKKYKKDNILYYENEITEYVMFVVVGAVKIYKLDKYENEIFLYSLLDKSIILNFNSLKDDKTLCFANIQITEDSEILFIKYSELKKHFLSQNILTLEFLEEVLNRNKKLQFIINRELVFNSTAKVAYMLHSDLEGFNAHKRQDVSLLLHIQPETLSRVLKRLARDGIISVDSGEVKILDEQRLVTTFGEVAI